jgi:hypothetical protein
MKMAIHNKPNLRLLRFDEEEKPRETPLSSGNGGGTFDGMEGRMSALEAHVKHIQSDLGEIKASLLILPTLGTKRDLITYTLTGLGFAVAMIAVVVGGLGWLETRAARIATPPAPAPIVIEVPAPPATPAPVNAPRR